MSANAANSTIPWVVVPGLILVGFLALVVVVMIILMFAAFFHRLMKSRPERAERRAERLPSPPAPGFWLACIGWILYTLAAAVVGVILVVDAGTSARPWEEATGFFAVLGLFLLLLTVVRYAWINRRRWAAAVSYAHPVAGQPEPVPVQADDRTVIAPPPRRPYQWLGWAALLVVGFAFAVWSIGKAGVKPIPARAVGIGEAVDDEAKFMAAPLVFIATLVIGAIVGGVLLFRSAARKRTSSPTQEEQSSARGPWITGGEVAGLLVSVVLGGTAVWAYLDGPGQPLTRVEFAGAGVLSVLVFVAVAHSRSTRKHKPNTPYDGYVRVRAQLGLPPNMTREEFNAKLEQELGQHAQAEAVLAGEPPLLDSPKPDVPTPVPGEDPKVTLARHNLVRSVVGVVIVAVSLVTIVWTITAFTSVMKMDPDDMIRPIAISMALLLTVVPVAAAGVIGVCRWAINRWIYPLPSDPTAIPNSNAVPLGERLGRAGVVGVSLVILGLVAGGVAVASYLIGPAVQHHHFANGGEDFQAAQVEANREVRERITLLVAAMVGMFVCGGGLLAWGAVRRPRRKLTPEELDALIKSVPPLTPEQRKAIFWMYLVCMALGVFFLLETVVTKLSTGSSIFVGSFIGMAAVSMTLMVREWAFKKTPDAAPPLAVAPLVLTPDPTPAGGACPTCGSPIPAGSPQGLCPRCLIRGAMPSVNATRARPVRPIDPPPPAEVNEFFPHLEVLELIGAGGMGAVYKARQPNLDRVVALKIVQSPTGDDDPVFAERFAREARAMARLDHPHIVTIHESGEAGGLPYMLMEFVDGITLRDAMENKVLTTAEALAVIPQICDALDYAHRTGVVHRDIKPENILIDQTGRVKIADFGLAKLAEAGGMTLTHTRQAMGTPHYMAPEQWEKPNEVDHRADIYALGVVLYELLTGELPLGRFDLPSVKGKGNARLDQVVLRALAKEPGQRYQQASDLKGALSGVGNWWNGPAPRHGFSEFRSKRSFLGLPLAHVVRGRNPATGKLQVAKGWIAVSDGTAVGGIAVGGVSAFGGVAVGGVLSVGLLAIGGAAGVGLLALGGTALGLALAVGGAAVSAGLAIGGCAIGTFAIGGAAVGPHTLGGSGTTPGFGSDLGDAVRGLFELP